jgi:hypothetical protein
MMFSSSYVTPKTLFEKVAGYKINIQQLSMHQKCRLKKKSEKKTSFTVD